MEANSKPDDESNQAGNDERGYQADTPPAASRVHMSVVSQILEFLSFGTPDVPQGIWRGGWTAVAWRIAQESAVERAIVCFWRGCGRQWHITGIFFDDGQSERAGSGGIPAASSYSGVCGMTWQGTVIIRRHGDVVWPVTLRLRLKLKLETEKGEGLMRNGS